MAANCAHKVFLDHRPRIKIAIRGSIGGITGISFAEGLVDEDVQRDVTEVATGRTARQNTETFLNALDDKIQTDGEPALTKFIEVLRKHDQQVHKTIINELESALRRERDLAKAPQVPVQAPQDKKQQQKEQ